MTTAAAVKPATTSSRSHSFRYAPIQSSIGVRNASARSCDMRYGEASEGASHVQQRTAAVVVYAAVEFIFAYRLGTDMNHCKFSPEMVHRIRFGYGTPDPSICYMTTAFRIQGQLLKCELSVTSECRKEAWPCE